MRLTAETPKRETPAWTPLDILANDANPDNILEQNVSGKTSDLECSQKHLSEQQ